MGKAIYSGVWVKIDNRLSSSDTDETVTIFPSLPVHSSSSYSSDVKRIGPTRMRFVVISIMSTAFLLQVFSQSIWSAIHESALLAFPNWTSRSLSLLPIWGSVMTAVLVFPACLTINKYGLKLSLLWSCCFFTLGTAIRCIPIMMYSCTMCLHLSAICLSVGGVEMTPLIITMSAQWFPKNERNMATGFCLAVRMLGSAATYVIGPSVVSVTNNGPLKPFIMRSQIMHMLYACLVLNVLVTLLVFMFFPRHTTPLSYESKLSMESHPSAKLFHSLKTLVTNYDVWCLVFAFTLSNTMSVPWAALIPSTFFKLRVPPEFTTECNLFMIFHAFALSISISTFADRAPSHSKKFILASRFVSTFFLFWLMLMMNFKVKLTATILECVVLIAFPYTWCSQSLLYEMGAELMYPLPECFVAGYMTLLNNLFVDFVYIVLYFYPHFDEYWLHIGVFVFSVLSIIFLCLTVDVTKKKKHVKCRNQKPSCLEQPTFNPDVIHNN